MYYLSMVTATTVICWIIGLGGILGFISAGFMPTFVAGPYMLMSIFIVVAAMYFNIKYKEINRRKLLNIAEIRLNNISGFKPRESTYSDNVGAKEGAE